MNLEEAGVIKKEAFHRWVGAKEYAARRVARRREPTPPTPHPTRHWVEHFAALACEDAQLRSAE